MYSNNHSGFAAYRPERKFSSLNMEQLSARGIVAEADRMRKEIGEAGLKEAKTATGLLTIKAANQWMIEASQRAVPKMLFDQLWFEGQVVILFADSGLGKSILAVQIADSISTGKAIEGFRMTAAAQQVLYCDFELSDKQFQGRYSEEYENLFQFNDNFMRAELNPDCESQDGKGAFEDQLIAMIEETVVRTGVKVLIVDNLTFLRQDNEQAKDALSLMRKLIELKKRYGLSILILAHTPKRHPGNPLTQNDLAGSKMLINFCDGAFAIGASSQGPGRRYIKEIKQRNTDKRYGDDNVVVCELRKEANFTGFHFVGYDPEVEHLKTISKSDVDDRKELAIEFHKQGKSNVAIAKELGVTEGAVRKYLKTM